MVRLQDFNKIVYNRPRVFRYDKSLSKIIGFDSEAYTSGATFLFCTSHGDVFTPDNLIDSLFSQDSKYISANFVTWNLKYDSGAILKCFTMPTIKKLQENHSVTTHYHGMKLSLSYLPHKQLKIKQGKRTIRFWDISPFYGRTKLETSARTYLNESKKDLDPKLFTVDFVEDHIDEIIKYCIQDCCLTQKLAELWISKFEETGIPVTSLYSEASISFAYISRNAEIVTPWEYWDSNKKLLQLAFEAYEGGKFEIIARGKFTGYEYDISSAYPYHISNLVDIRNAHILYSRTYQRDAVYGFIRCKIKTTDSETHLPCGIFKKLRIYPMGEYYLTITKQEYEYLQEIGVYCKIIDAAWIIVYRRSYPYRKIFNELYSLKTQWKAKDKIRSHNFKIVMNGFYGKMAQCIQTPEGDYMAGQGWNPIYAAVTTANTRIQVTRLQNHLKEKCLAVHTDSVICTERIPDSFIGEGLGKFEKVIEGDGVIVACGIYEIAGQCALKGFRKGSITDMLKENPGVTEVELKTLHVESWLQVAAQGHDINDINVFDYDYPKKFKFNCDTKRLWPGDVTSDDLLNNLQYSSPLIESQETIPSYWKE